MSTVVKSRLTYSVAASRGAQVCQSIFPCCIKAELAGSIRRQREHCGDIDLVCIPELAFHTDLLGEKTLARNYLFDHLTELVQEAPTRLRWDTGSDNPQGSIYRLWVMRNGIDQYLIDILTANEANYASRLLCRTGSMQHNIFLAERARKLGLKWESLEGVSREGVRLPATTEAEIYAHLGMPFIDPQDRELPHLQTLKLS